MYYTTKSMDTGKDKSYSMKSRTPWFYVAQGMHHLYILIYIYTLFIKIDNSWRVCGKFLVPIDVFLIAL